MELTRHTRHATGISGGGWALTALSYFQPGPDGPSSDAAFLGSGSPAAPASLSLAALDRADAAAGRTMVTRQCLLREAVKLFRTGMSPADAWHAVLKSCIFAPVGLGGDPVFAWDEPHAAALRSRNPSLAAERIVAARPGWPFPVVGVALVGPLSLVPHFPLEARTMMLLEVTPLYAGVPRPRRCRYVSETIVEGRRELDVAVGDLIEAVALGTDAPAPVCLLPGASKGQLEARSSLNRNTIYIAR